MKQQSETTAGFLSQEHFVLGEGRQCLNSRETNKELLLNHLSSLDFTFTEVCPCLALCPTGTCGGLGSFLQYSHILPNSAPAWYSKHQNAETQHPRGEPTAVGKHPQGVDALGWCLGRRLGFHPSPASTCAGCIHDFKEKSLESVVAALTQEWCAATS